MTKIVENIEVEAILMGRLTAGIVIVYEMDRDENRSLFIRLLDFFCFVR